MSDVITLALVFVSWLPAALFLVVYTVAAPFWQTETGRHAWTFSLVLTILLTSSLTRRVFGDYPGREWIVLAMFAAFTVVLWWQLAMLWRYQVTPWLRARREHKRARRATLRSGTE
jgi:uncharacterized PurR-regulated membrane protein YhhQ (DUF165 family)